MVAQSTGLLLVQMLRTVSSRGLYQAKSRVRYASFIGRKKVPQSPPPASKTDESAFVHDYTVGPATYSYTTDQNSDLFERFPLMNAKRLSRLGTRPRQVRMLAKDFMDDSLYNPNYGYFSKQVQIFSPKAFNFNNIKNADEFLAKWTASYENTDSAINPNAQMWHTPVELFQPHYGRALARYIVMNYKLALYPYRDLIIYEMGGGNGTLMMNILDYLRDHHPEVYERTHYRIIEISSNLASIQDHALNIKAKDKGHSDHVQVINKSLFDWDQTVLDPCYFIALEVLDNLAHDVIRYDNVTLKPYQAYVVVDGNGDMQEVYSDKLDPWATQLLTLRNEMPEYAPSWELGYHPLAQPKMLRQLKNMVWPFRGDLSDPEYIPTRYLELLHVLKTKFPQHRLLMSDFNQLPDAIPGYNSPVVQTVLEKTMTPVSTYMVLQGYFDLLFPTDFDLAADLYTRVCGKHINTCSHSDFLETWADSNATVTRTGENPMLSFYTNAAFLYS